MKPDAYFFGYVQSRTYLLLLAAISSLIFLMSLLHFSISTTFRPSTVNKGKQQGCYHGESRRISFHNCEKFQRALTVGLSSEPASSYSLPRFSHTQVLPKRYILKTHRNSLLPILDNSYNILIHRMAITSQLFHNC